MTLRISKLGVLILTVIAIFLRTSIAGAVETVIINEFMASNGKTLADVDGDFSDWIEIYNSGAVATNLDGWYLTDDPTLAKLWRIPATTVKPNSYLVIFASGKDRTNAAAELHTSFSLKAAGDYLALLKPDLTKASEFSPSFPPQTKDYSYGIPLGGGADVFFATPTPNAPNLAGFVAFVDDTKFSVSRGFYDQPFDLSISCATAGATIRYTTNGIPPSATNGMIYSAPIQITATTTLRAIAVKAGYLPSNIDTETYIFLDDVLRQEPDGRAPGPGWMVNLGGNSVSYGMDPNIVTNALYKGTIKNDLKTLPSFSIVTDLKNLFDPATGIYTNPSQDGRNWERPCSIELIYPDGTKGFQIDAGLRIRGGFSRSTDNPKHGLRFFFRDEYGQAPLKYPLNAPLGTDTFDSIDLRTFQNYSWSFQGDPRGVFIRDQFSRDTQIAMGQNAERGNYFHLYINGQYWGLYNTCERPEASFAETYFGGDKNNYDVIKVEAGPYTINATDGNMAAWTRLYQAGLAGFVSTADYFKVQGRNPDGTMNPAFENLIDIDNLIDYMLTIFYGGNLDAPISNFLGNTSPNNWYGIRDRTGTAGFRFFAHDSEHTLLDVNENRTGPYTSGDTDVLKSNPQWIFQKLTANPEFRLKFSDHVQKHFFDGGALTPQAASNRFMFRKNQIDRAVVGESARWGDSKREPAITRTDWLAEVNRIVGSYMPQRSTIVLNQFRTKGWLPSLAAPSFNQAGGNINPGFALSMSASAGTIYYTEDGSDPRLIGGGLSATARSYTSPITLNENSHINARVRNGTLWSALVSDDFVIIQNFQDVIISEIMYNPPGTSALDGDAFEFIELKNTGNAERNLSGAHFTNGIVYTFPNGTILLPGRFIVLVSNSSAFTNKYPGLPFDGVYTNKLSNSGEAVTIVHASGGLLASASYSDQPPWPVSADGGGFSLVVRDPNASPAPADAANWRASFRPGGSPGEDDPIADVPPVWINEVLTHTDLPDLDSIELYNPNSTGVDLGDWYLTDDRETPKKYKIPAGKTIPASGFLVFTETDFNPTPGIAPSFTLNSHGEEVYLFSADAGGNLTGYSDGFSFGAAENGVSFGRYINSVGEILYPAQSTLTPGAANSGPRVGPVIFNEIRYQPFPGDEEFIELRNITGNAVKLYDPANPTNGWKIGGVDFEFPTGAEIAANGFAVIAGTDPAQFRSRNNVPENVPVFGPFGGALEDNGELIELKRPDSPDVNTNGTVFVPYVVIDSVRYSDKAPWPIEAAGQGPSLERIDVHLFGNDPSNWRASAGAASPGIDNGGNRSPRVNAGPDITQESSAFPVNITINATASDDSLPRPPGVLTLRWTQAGGPQSVVFTSTNSAVTTVSVPAFGAYIFRLTASDGELQSSDDVTIIVRQPPASITLVPAGSVWKYLDNGSDQGTAWRLPGFDDSIWRAGPAQLGYDDGTENDEATLLGYGPNSSAKYITYYFRHTFTVTDAAQINALNLSLLRDDGAVIYLNGQEAVRDNMPEGDVNYQTVASSVVSGAAETTQFFDHPVDVGLLKEGVNTLAVEIHQSGGTSSDISFDLGLTAVSYGANQAPVVNAGPDLTMTLGDHVNLNGSVADDGLPIIPGRTTNFWSQASGPGTVTFSDATAQSTLASFSTAGNYVLKLSANDGVLSSEDRVSILVNSAEDPYQTWRAAHFTAAELNDPTLSGDNADPDGDQLTNRQEYVCGTDPRDAQSRLGIAALLNSNGAHVVSFSSVSGKTYTVQALDSIGGAWGKIGDVTAASSDGTSSITDTNISGAARFYRIVTPQQP